ncbi:phage tail protein, partial [Acinetobacter baumannii]|nr:phage tail protein [Acinetobacter baumannii]MCJ9203013.1 phage tail protein [Acinetobacter baumannii]MCJ9353733.1 phage tail protein [Acinetobacter baumannii]
SIELNDDAQKQPITLEKLGVGDYLIKGSLGFAQEGWYIEMPKDANGNVLVAVAYKQLENNDISIKTYKKKFDIETASIVPDLENPVDIPEGRNIDIRFHEEIVLDETLPDDIEQ